jgi:sporulation protein YlmC with PRC-barrel domain
MAMRTGTTGTTGTTGQTNVLSASTLIGNKVYNLEGEKLGDIKDVMLDVDLGRIAYAVLSFGGFLGMGDKLFAIPFEAFRVDPSNDRIALNVPKEKLENAPGFDKDHWPSTADRTWAAQIHRHYGYRPYWEAERTIPRA